MIIKNYWQFITILVTLIIFFSVQIKNYGALENKVFNVEIGLAKEIKDSREKFDKLTERIDRRIDRLTITITRTNTLMEIYLTNRGIIPLNKQDTSSSRINHDKGG